MTARMVLNCEPESFRFDRRVLSLNTPIRVSRSCIRNQGSRNNANFDCKVLSRNHALLSYENGKFFIQDTKSSNGTFVNGIRLSASRNESLPYELSSGDLLQFGVPVEDNLKQPYVSVITKIELYDTNGYERKFKRLECISLTFDQIFTLSGYLKTAFFTESSLENRIVQMQQLLKENLNLTNHKWSLMLKNDELLSTIKNLENRVRFYAKNFPHATEQENVEMIKEEKRLILEATKKALKTSHDENIKLKTTLSVLQNTYQLKLFQINILSKNESEMSKNIKKLQNQIDNLPSTVETLTNDMDAVKHQLNDFRLFNLNLNELALIRSKIEELSFNLLGLSSSLTAIRKESMKSVNNIKQNTILYNIDNCRTLLEMYEKRLTKFSNELNKTKKLLSKSDIEENNNIDTEDSSLYIMNTKNTLTNLYQDEFICNSKHNDLVIDEFKQKLAIFNCQLLKLNDEVAILQNDVNLETDLKVRNEFELSELKSSLKAQNSIRQKINRKLHLMEKFKYENIENLKLKLTVLKKCYQQCEHEELLKKEKISDLNKFYLKIVDKSQNIFFFYLMPLLFCSLYWFLIILKNKLFSY